VRSDCI